MKQNKDNTEQHKGAGKRVKEATKLNAETRDPPSQDPGDHKEQPFRPNTSKRRRRVATRVVKNE